MAPTLPTGPRPTSAQRGVDGLVAALAIGDEYRSDAEVGSSVHGGVDHALTSIVRCVLGALEHLDARHVLFRAGHDGAVPSGPLSEVLAQQLQP